MIGGGWKRVGLKSKFNWRSPLYAAVATLIVFLPFALWSADLGAVIIASAALVDNYSAVRDATRWLLFSKGYKAKVLEQSASESRGLKHAYWDGWGWAGETQRLAGTNQGPLTKQAPRITLSETAGSGR